MWIFVIAKKWNYYKNIELLRFHKKILINQWNYKQTIIFKELIRDWFYMRI